MKNTIKSTIRNLTGFALMTILLVNSSCNEEDDVPKSMEPEIKTKTTGFVVIGQTTSESAVVKYIEELPENGGTIDLSSEVTDFPRFQPNTVYDHAIFLPNPDEAVGGFAKYVVDAEGELTEEAILPTAATNSYRIAVKDSETGVFHDRSTPNSVTIFNPITMEITGSIDMSEGFVPGDIDQSYVNMFFRDNDLFMPILGNNLDRFTSYIVHHASLSSNSFVGNTQRDGNGQGLIQWNNNFGQRLTDDQSNLYIMDGGDYGGAGVPASINKIPVGSNEFDPEYQFFPAQVLNPQNVFLPTANLLNLTQGTKAIALVNAETPQAAIDIVIGAGGIQNLTQEQIQEVFGILFSAKSAKWCEVDLAAKTVTPIGGVPNLGVFASTSVFKHEGAFYFGVPAGSEMPYYRYDPNTGSAEKAFTITGADFTTQAAAGVYNLAENN